MLNVEVRDRDKKSYIFSTHAVKRCVERGLSMEAVRRALHKGRRYRMEVGQCWCCIWGAIRVILDPTGSVVITAYERS
ncbi:MAG: DUF4258 domain-containing protein [Desulfomonilaceae bacterium]